MLELVSQKGVYPFLNRLCDIRTPIGYTEIADLLAEFDAEETVLDDLLASDLLRRALKAYYLSPKGERTTILLRVVNGDANLADLWSRLRELFPGMAKYELITANITEFFIDSLLADSMFIRLLICSPWINLDADHLEKLEAALNTAVRIYPNLDVKIVTHPQEGGTNRHATPVFELVQNFGGEVYFHDHKNAKDKYILHTKLYILEPGPRGGSHFAILGSENLTGQRNVELAIRVENDTSILRRLNDYYQDLVLQSTIR